MSKLGKIVFVVDGGKIVESAIRDLSGYIDETTTPHGVAPRFHVRKVAKFSVGPEDFDSREDAECYAVDGEQIVEGISHQLWTWGFGGNNPKCVDRFESEDAAQAALEETFLNDFYACSIYWFTTREEAEKALAEDQAGNAMDDDE